MSKQLSESALLQEAASLRAKIRTVNAPIKRRFALKAYETEHEGYYARIGLLDDGGRIELWHDYSSGHSTPMFWCGLSYDDANSFNLALERLPSEARPAMMLGDGFENDGKDQPQQKFTDCSVEENSPSNKEFYLGRYFTRYSMKDALVYIDSLFNDIQNEKIAQLQEGQIYPYLELVKIVGGGSRYFYLPFKGSKVFAAFLNPNWNPDAPNIILVGDRPRVKRAALILQSMAAEIPVFLKQSKDHWRYEGMYKSGVILDSTLCAGLAEIAGRKDVAFALELVKVGEKDVGQPTYLEGPCGQVTRNAYERSLKARADCLNYYGRKCNVCNIDFGVEYGERGLGFIHVHHLHPLHKNEGLQPTNPIEDLRPVCPNCHSMLHAGKTLLTPDELREIFWSEESVGARGEREKPAA